MSHRDGRELVACGALSGPWTSIRGDSDEFMEPVLHNLLFDKEGIVIYFKRTQCVVHMTSGGFTDDQMWEY